MYDLSLHLIANLLLTLATCLISPKSATSWIVVILVVVITNLFFYTINCPRNDRMLVQ